MRPAAGAPSPRRREQAEHRALRIEPLQHPATAGTSIGPMMIRLPAALTRSTAASIASVMK